MSRFILVVAFKRGVCSGQVDRCSDYGHGEKKGGLNNRMVKREVS